MIDCPHSLQCFCLFSGKNKIITLAMIKRRSINSDGVFSARSIQSYAETTVKNCKIATAVTKQFVQSDGSIPSGWSKQDVYNKVLDIMYTRISNEPKIKNIIDGDEREEVRAKERPARWIFNGFMVYVLYGPLAPEDRRSSIITGGKRSCCDTVVQNTHSLQCFCLFNSISSISIS